MPDLPPATHGDTRIDRKIFNVSTPEQVIKALDTEIAHLKDADKRPGWTPWALLGSFGAVVWLIFSQLESTAVNLENIPVLYLAFYTTLINILTLYEVLTPKRLMQSNSLRFQLSSSLSGYRAASLIGLGHSLLLFYVAVVGDKSLGWVQLILMGGNYILIILLSLTAFILSFFHLPLPMKRVGAVPSIFQAVVSTLLLWASYGYFATVLSAPTGVSYGDYRVSLLLVAAFYLFWKLVSGTRETPLLATLIEIRRDFVFGRLDVEAALRRADIALAGLEVSDLLHGEVSKALAAFEQIDAEQRVKAEKLDGILAEMEKNSAAPFTKEKATEVLEAVGALDVHSDKIRALFKEITETIGKFSKRGTWLTRLYPETTPSISALEKKLWDTLNQGEEISRTNSERMDAVLQPVKDYVQATEKEIAELKAWGERMDEVQRRVKGVSQGKNELTDTEVAQLKHDVRSVREELDILVEKWPQLKQRKEQTLAELAAADAVTQG